MKLYRQLKNYLSENSFSRELIREIEANEGVTSNYLTLSVFSVIGSVCVLMMYLASFVNPSVIQHRPVYLAGSLLSLVLFGVSQLVYRRRPRAFLIMVYAAMSLYMMYGIVLGTVTDPGMQSTTFLVLMEFVPLLFLDNPLRMGTAIVFFDGVFILMALRTKQGAVLAADLTDATIFGILSLISYAYATRIKYQRYASERKLLQLSNTDQLTGLKNRNCYEQELHSHADTCRHSLSLVFIDVNGLHEQNNAFGHEAGDRMLIFIGHTLRDQFGSEYVYRIGGDEYVAFVPDCTHAVVEEQLRRVRTIVTEAGYSISCGIHTQPKSELNPEKLVQEADRKMYAEKTAYYAAIGTTRTKTPGRNID